MEAKESLSIEEEFVILSFGLIRRYKGIPHLIEAFEGFPEEIAQKSRLLIVGEVWEDRKELLEQIEKSPYSEKITLVDEYVPDYMIPTYFSAADVLVLPYLRASQSGIAHIGMSFGKPVVVSEVGGLKESMADYKGTFFVRPQNVDDIREQILNLFGNNEKYDPPVRTWDKIVEVYQNAILNG